MTFRPAVNAEMTAMLSALSGFERQFDNYYELEEQLAAGAYGRLYRCHYKSNPSKQVAAKFIARRKLRKTEERDALSEVDIMQEICGTVENVVEFVDFFACEDYFIIVQGLARGGDVFARIAKRNLYNEQDARSVAIKLLQTLKTLHDRGIIHRDIKLENLLLAAPNDCTSILLCDFGFATYLPEEGFLTRRCGTPAYCSPEVWKKQAYGTSSDMWSLGCALYMLLDGRPPFEGKDNNEIYLKTCKGNVRFEGPQWEAVSQEAKEVIQGLLVVDPDKRLTAKQALESTWIQSGLTDALFVNLDWGPNNCCEMMNNLRDYEVGRSYVISSVVPLNMG